MGGPKVTTRTEKRAAETEQEFTLLSSVGHPAEKCV
jgi:hypothetical protein